MNTIQNRKYRLVWETLNKLHDYSGTLVSLVVDHYLQIPAVSYMDETGLSVIRINLTRIPLSESVIAHILAHEYGHHILMHVRTEPYKLSHEELESREDEADIYAAKFIHDQRYAVAPIALFISHLAPARIVATKRIGLLGTFSK